MSAAQPLVELVDFDGVVECRLEAGAVTVTLRGRERGGGAVEVLLAGARIDDPGAAAPGALPATLHEVRLLEDAGPAEPHRLQLRSRERQLDLRARSVQLHRDPGTAFYAAVPPVIVPVARRVGWALLLALLRLPGMAALLTALRGRR